MGVLSQATKRTGRAMRQKINLKEVINSKILINKPLKAYPYNWFQDTNTRDMYLVKRDKRYGLLVDMKRYGHGKVARKGFVCQTCGKITPRRRGKNIYCKKCLKARKIVWNQRAYLKRKEKERAFQND